MRLHSRSVQDQAAILPAIGLSALLAIAGHWMGYPVLRYVGLAAVFAFWIIGGTLALRGRTQGRPEGAQMNPMPVAARRQSAPVDPFAALAESLDGGRRQISIREFGATSTLLRNMIFERIHDLPTDRPLTPAERKGDYRILTHGARYDFRTLMPKMV